MFKENAEGELDYTDPLLYKIGLIPFCGESILGFGRMDKDKQKVMGIGMVSKIVTAEYYDMVYMNFGRHDRPVVVWEYNSRKQLVTLSRNKYAIFYGFIKMLVKNNEKKPVLYARALQGWYVPTAFDVKKKFPDFKYDEKEENDTEFTEFLNDIQEIKDGE